MLSEKRIREAESNFKIYLEEGLIRKENFRKEIFETYCTKQTKAKPN